VCEQYTHTYTHRPIDETCSCMVCKQYTRCYLHNVVTRGIPSASMLVSYHNIAYMQVVYVLIWSIHAAVLLSVIVCVCLALGVCVFVCVCVCVCVFLCVCSKLLGCSARDMMFRCVLTSLTDKQKQPLTLLAAPDVIGSPIIFCR